MRVTPAAALRLGVVALGAASGVLLVRALDQGLAGDPRALGGGHLALGLVAAAAVMPGPILGFLVTPKSSERARGLAVGGSGVTALAAVFGGALLYGRLFLRPGAGITEVVAFGWCVLALPLAAIDWLRLRRGGGASEGEES